MTPIELGARVYDRGSWMIEALIGARLQLEGQLINSFLLYPNGFQSAASRADLREARDDQPWEAYLSIVFGRRLD